MSVADMPCVTVEQVLRLRTKAMELEKQNAELVKILHNLEVSANTVSACYTRNPDNFALALKSLDDDAIIAREAIIKNGEI